MKRIGTVANLTIFSDMQRSIQIVASSNAITLDFDTAYTLIAVLQHLCTFGEDYRVLLMPEFKIDFPSFTPDTELPHEFQGIAAGVPDSPCTFCGKADRDSVHNVCNCPSCGCLADQVGQTYKCANCGWLSGNAGIVEQQ